MAPTLVERGLYSAPVIHEVPEMSFGDAHLSIDIWMQQNKFDGVLVEMKPLEYDAPRAISAVHPVVDQNALWGENFSCEAASFGYMPQTNYADADHVVSSTSVIAVQWGISDQQPDMYYHVLSTARMIQKYLFTTEQTAPVNLFIPKEQLDRMQREPQLWRHVQEIFSFGLSRASRG